MPTPVHLFCDNPSSRFARGKQQMLPAPLLDLMEAPEEGYEDVTIPEFLRRLAT